MDIPFGTRAQTHHNASHGELRSRVLEFVDISAKINTQRIKCLVCYLFVGFYLSQTNEWTESNNSENENCCCCAVCAIRCMGNANDSFFLHAIANENILLETSLNVNNQYSLSIFHFLPHTLSLFFSLLSNLIAISEAKICNRIVDRRSFRSQHDANDWRNSNATRTFHVACFRHKSTCLSWTLAEFVTNYVRGSNKYDRICHQMQKGSACHFHSRDSLKLMMHKSVDGALKMYL